MYTDKRKSRAPWVLLLALVLLVLGIYLATGPAAQRDVNAESAAALKAAVERGALQCYVVEGVYPPDLDYLEAHYGLQVNHEDFYVTYDVFASNVLPDIRVTPREHA